jgi:hypothetical protein
MNENPEVRSWLDELEHPLKDVILAVRRTFLEADQRISEMIKWRSPTFMYKGNLASIDPKAKRHVAVLFHRGAEIPGDHQLMEGDGKLARYARFPDMDSVVRARSGLIRVTQAWCDSKD